MITFETLRRIEQEEKVSVKLAKLPDGFLQEVKEYLENKEAISNAKGDKWEMQSSVQRFHSIMDMRERKIVNFSLSYVRSGAVPENMLPEERTLFDTMARSVSEFQKKRDKAMSGEQFRFKTVALLQELPQFVGIDMGHYGPYKVGDIATVPDENAKLLVEKGGAEVIEPG